jgi:L-ascorbate metabolism protein UlaG (beta-lactamase superfamily)
LKRKTLRFSRRRFISLAGLTFSGSWLSFSDCFAARFFRERIAETGRSVLKAKSKPTPSDWTDQSITAAWLGHSTVLLNFYGITILTDPVLNSRVGANLGLGTLGPKRLTAPALQVKELPPIDLILLSHAHLDHLDLPTLQHFGSATRIVTARRTADILAGTNMPRRCELGWGDRTLLRMPNGDVEIEGFEVNHWGGRWSHREDRGWNGYVISRNGKKVIFGGDTAMCETFKSLRSHGPFELALMPIGAYNPWIRAHCNPEEAVSMANDAGAKYILPIHHQSFTLGRESFSEPIERFELALHNEPERVALRNVGETFRLA